MTTHAGSWPIDTSLRLLSPLSTQKADLTHATKSFIPSSQTSSVESEIFRSALSRSCSTSSSTSISLIGEKTSDHSKANPMVISTIEGSNSGSEPSKASREVASTGSTAGRSFTDSSHSDMAEFRTSQRVRKPTSKARALVGTNFFRSLNQNGYSIDRSETPEHHQDGESPQQIQPEMSRVEIQHSQKSSASDESAMPNSELNSMPLLHSSDNGVNTSTNDTSPPRRLSRRERKPAAKLVEGGEIHETKKRKFMEESLEPKMVKRIKLSISPSKLREYVNATHDEQRTQLSVELPPAEGLQPELKTGAQSTGSEINTPKRPKTCHVVLKLPSQLLAQLGQKIEVAVTPTKNEASIENESHCDSGRSRSKNQCDLSCLSPSSILLAFSQVAVNWPDSDSELGLELAQEDEESRLKKSLSQYCRCDQPPATSTAKFKKAGNIAEKSSSSASVQEVANDK